MALRPRARPVAAGLLATALAVAGSGCARTSGSPAVPQRAPDVSGVVTDADGPEGPALADPSDGYFEGMLLLRGDPLVVAADGGAAVPPSDLRDGDRVEVWIGDGCAESFPVQCTVEVVRVSG